ncbi:MAG: transglutaminase-like domain-containing protein, partial [Thermofilaceae archaeon]
MRKVILVLLFTLTLAHPTITLGEPQNVQVYFWVRLTVVNNSTNPYPLKPLLLDLPLNDTYQRSRLINVTVKLNGVEAYCRTRVTDGDCGTRYLEVQCPRSLPAKGTLEITAVSEVYVERFRAPELSFELSGFVSHIPPELKLYTKAEGSWRYDQVNMAYLAEVAREIAGEEINVLAIVTRLTEWLWKKVEYGTGPPRYPNETLPPALISEGRGEGDCDDQANLLILMLRSLGIPSYLKIALITDFNYRNERVSWAPGSHFYWSFLGIDYGHGWAEVYVPPWGWLPVDLTYNLGKENPLNAIATSATSDHWKWRTTATIRIGNICHTDYIGESRAVYAESLSSPLFFYTQYAVVRKGDSLKRVTGFFQPLPLPWVKRTSLKIEYPSKAKAFENIEVNGLLEPSPSNTTLLIEV